MNLFFNLLCIFVLFACLTFIWNCMIIVFFLWIIFLPPYLGILVCSFVYLENILIYVTAFVLQPFCSVSSWSILNSDNFFIVPMSVGFGAAVLYLFGYLLVYIFKSLGLTIKSKKMVRPRRR